MTQRLLRLVLLIAVTWINPALGQTTSVAAEGQGPTRQAAIAQALVSAVEQTTGVAISAQQRSGTNFESIVSDTEGTVRLEEQAQAAITRQTNGIIRTYRVDDMRQEPGGFVAQVTVEVAVFRPTSNTGETRRRLAVAEFRDERGRPTEFGRQMREALIQHLTQSRRFAVLDRTANAQYDAEMALIQRDAPLTEQVRVGQVLGADYMVVGTMRGVGTQRSEEYIGITGQTVTRSAARGALDFQVIEVATRQVKWAGNVASSNGGDLRVVLEDMATRAGRDITQTIYPLRLVRADSPTEIIINQGGVTVLQGQRFRMMVQGDELKDPYSGESLGFVERDIGEIEVQRVDPRISYAKLVAGGLPPQGANVVLRPSRPAAPRAAPASAPAARPAGAPRSIFD